MFSVDEAIIISDALFFNRHLSDFAHIVQREHLLNSVAECLAAGVRRRAFIHREGLLDKLASLTEREASELTRKFRKIGRVVDTPIMHAKLRREGIVSQKPFGCA